MSPDQAWAELGVARDTPWPEVRRAYLRLLKVRKPESDPEGFKKLRAAYELIEKLTSVPETDDARQGPVVFLPSRAPVSPIAPVSPVSPVSPMGDVPRGSDAGGDSPDPFPRDVTPPPLRPARAEPSIDVRAALAEIEAIQAAWDAGGPAAAAAPAIAHATAALSRVGGPVDVGALLRVALGLHGTGESPRARELVAATGRLIEALGPGAMSPDTVATWSALREIDLASSEAPPAVIAPIARATMEGEPNRALGDLMTWVGRNAGPARRLSERLKTDAPLVASLVQDAYVATEPPRIASPRPLPRWAWWPAVVIFTNVMRWIAASAPHVAEPLPPRPAYTAPAPHTANASPTGYDPLAAAVASALSSGLPSDASSDAPSTGASPSAVLVAARALDEIVQSAEEAPQALREAARDLRGAARFDDCDGQVRAFLRFQALRVEAPSVSTPALLRAVAATSDALASECP